MVVSRLNCLSLTSSRTLEQDLERLVSWFELKKEGRQLQQAENPEEKREFSTTCGLSTQADFYHTNSSIKREDSSVERSRGRLTQG
jgi:hypothetical protein